MIIGSIIIIAFYYPGVGTGQHLHLPIPGSVIGMLYLFIFLM